MFEKIKAFFKKLKDKLNKPDSSKKKSNMLFFLVLSLFFIANGYFMKNADTVHQQLQPKQSLSAQKTKAPIFVNNAGLIVRAIQDNTLEKINVVKLGADSVLMEVYLKNKDILLYDSLDGTGLFSLEKEAIYPNAVEYNVFKSVKQLKYYKYFEAKQLKEDTQDSSGISGFLWGVLEWVGKNFISLLFLVLLFVSIRMTGSLTKFKNKFQMLKPENIEGSLDDLVGMADIKKEVLHLEDMYNDRDMYTSHGIKKPFNIMLSGPAGTGKTKIASLLAKRLNLPILFGSGANLETGYVGGGANSLKSLEAEAKKIGRCIIFLDEAQSLFMQRGRGSQKWEDDTSNTLLAMLDGVHSKDDAEIVWIVASNFDETSMSMDDAMLRRFQLKINFRLPNKHERFELIERFLAKKDSKFIMDGLNLNFMAEITANLAPAIIETIITKASMIAIRDNKGMITDDILFKAYEQTTMGLTDRETTKDLDKQRVIIARHELGHFFMHYHNSKSLGLVAEELREKIPVLKISTEANSRFNALGYVLNKQDDVKLKTRTEYENEVKVLYGGVACEELLYGEKQITSGSHNDIERATKLLKAMIANLSMYKKSKLNYEELGSKQIDEKIIKEIEHKSENLYAQTLDDLKEYLPLIQKITPILLEKYVLSKEEIFDVIDTISDN